MKKRVITVLIPVVLIILVAAAALGSMLYNRYSYSKTYADLNSYFGITHDDECALILQDEIIEETAIVKDGSHYFPLSTVEKYFTDRFYVNADENVLIFTTDTDIIKVNIGDESNIMYVSEAPVELGYNAAFYENDVLCIEARYVQKFANFEYYCFTEPNHMQIYTTWDEYTSATLSKKTAVRYRGGRKSDILEKLPAGAQVTILEKLENWSKVKTENSIIGYVENRLLKNEQNTQRMCSTDFKEIVYKNVTKEGKINLAFHQMFDEADKSALDSDLATQKAINVISPTWFRLSDNSGGFSSIANASYVERAHELGIDVWALITDVDSESRHGVTIDFVELLSSSANRRALIDGLMAEVDTYNLDGINIDFEKVKKPAGIHFIQFLRELSIETRKRNIVLSVDNFVPSEYTAHYDRKEQGIIADYIIIMGYDEHYVGGGVAGSNSSISFVENGIADTKESVPAEKIINAIPFYTRIWESGPNGLTAATLTMASQNSWIASTGATPVWLDEFCQNYVEYQSGETLYQCWLEDTESIRVKLQVMEAQNIKGVASWKLGLEDNAVWDVIREYLNN